jgi:hypothetical protein
LIGRRRQRAFWWVAIVLPGFLLRSLIPVGFMPMFGPGLHLSLMLCEGYAPIATAAAAMPMAVHMDMPMPMDMPMDRAGAGRAPHPEPRDHQDHSTCPYGTGPTLAAVALWTTPALRLERPADPPAVVPQVPAGEIIPRAQSPRGPPIEV